MYKYLFFDLDGTLINSYPRTLNAIKKIIKKHLGIDVPYEELFIDAMVDLGHLFRKYNKKVSYPLFIYVFSGGG